MNLHEQLRRQWRRQHPPDEHISIAALKHIDRARQVPLPDGIDAESLPAQVRNHYFDLRCDMSEARVRELGARSAAAATRELVVTHFIPNPDQATSLELSGVDYGLQLAKQALRQTVLY